MDDKASVIIAAVVCVTVVMCFALYMKVNGTLLATGIGAICTIIGYFFGVKVEAKKTAASSEK